MIDLKRVLHPTDFSQCARRSLEYACSLAERFDAELHLLYVMVDYSAPVFVPELGFPPPDALQREARERAEKELAELPNAAWCTGRAVVRSVRSGPPFLEIIRYAKEHDIDLIVLGTHGQTELTHVLLGSVAEKVVRKAPCPVLIVRPEGHQFVMP